MAKPSDHAVDAFLKEILEVCQKHRLWLQHYRIEYDEFDSEEGFWVQPMHGDGDTDLIEIRTAYAPGT